MTAIGTLKYRLYKDNRAKSATKGQFFARAVQDRTVDFEAFVSHMAGHNSPYSRGVIHGVLIDMLSCLQELVLDGKSVRLGELGLFSIGLTGKGSPTVKDWSVDKHVKGVKLRCRNTKTWGNSELRKKCNITELSAYTADGTATTPNP
jgi:predicted histone-like DNA-binding protein